MAKSEREFEDGDDAVAAVRSAIVAAALIHVPFDGWGDAALLAGADDAGYTSDDVRRLFPGGAIDAIRAHSSMADSITKALGPAPKPRQGPVCTGSRTKSKPVRRASVR